MAQRDGGHRLADSAILFAHCPTAMPRCMPPTTCTQGVTTCTQGVLLRAHDGDAMLTLKLLMMIMSS